MNLNKIGIIIGREYTTRVKKKSFILTTLLTPVFMAVLILIPSVIMLYQGRDQQKVMLVDRSGLVQPYFQSGEKVEYSFADTNADIEQMKAGFDDLGIDVLVVVSGLDADNNVSVTTYSKEPVSLEDKSSISRKVETAVRDYKLKAYDIVGYEDIMAKVKTDVPVEALTLTSDGGEKADSVEAYMIMAYIMSFLIYMFTFMFGNMVMRGVIEEKSNRIVEVVVSSVSSFELMMGKIIGVAGVALTQFIIWIVLTLLLVSAGGALFGADLLSSGAAAVPGAAEATDAVAGSVANGILGGLASLNIPYLLVFFLIYFLLGYLLYASMFAAVGSAVDNEADTGQLAMPITIPLMLGLFIMLHTFQHPSSGLSFWASIIPFTSPMVMLARLPFGVVPGWQLALSIALLLLTFVFVTYLSARIYRVGILMYGKKASFKDLYKWMKSKK
ncbi:MAG: ABC transporter permease [Bacteroidales bacterium]|nr:ABC transporter permease [Bacteroidales bacterium]